MAGDHDDFEEFLNLAIHNVTGVGDHSLPNGSDVDQMLVAFDFDLQLGFLERDHDGFLLFRLDCDDYFLLELLDVQILFYGHHLNVT